MVPRAGATFDRPDLGAFPDWQSVLPGPRRSLRVGFNAKLLWELVRALDGRAVIMTLGLDDQGQFDGGPLEIEVTGAPKDTIAVLMPIRFD